MKKILGLVTLWMTALAGCAGPEIAPGDTGSFVGPSQLPLYDRLGPDAKVDASARHGEEVEILEERRSFVRIRTSGGAEGWTQRKELITGHQLARLRELAAYAAGLPSHGAATVYGPLNVHTEPFRAAPSFHQIQESEKVEVAARLLMPRMSYPYKLPAPGPGDDGPGIELSRVLASPRQDRDWLRYYQAIAASEWDGAEPAGEDWNLVRLADGRAGWVLARLLVMAIPDEVAQYASGARITSYFSLGSVPHGDGAKHHWLWTTIRENGRPYHFDSFRVFIWSRRNARYETARIARNLKGYFPVEVGSVAVERKKETAEVPGFSLVVEEEGRLVRLSYAFEGYRVTPVGKVMLVEEFEGPRDRDRASTEEAAPDQSPSLWQRFRSAISGWLAG